MAIQMKVQLDTNPGPFLGRPITPPGWMVFGSPSNCAVNPEDGMYFGQGDVVPDAVPVAATGTATGTATLHSPPNGWQITDTGQTLLSQPVQAAIVAANTAAVPTPAVPGNTPQGSILAPPDPLHPAFFTVAK